jgi:ethanolamine ammonia-lyase small subunit
MPDGRILTEDGWQRLRRFTAARIALGSAGHAVPTGALLEFQLAHAQARDAIHAQLETARLREELSALECTAIALRSEATTRELYVRRPDLGRRLNGESRELVRRAAATACDVAIVIADGLSPLGVNRHAVPLIRELLPRLRAAGLTSGGSFLLEHGRVAAGDEIGELAQARLVIVLIGERPGLSSPDSLGVYLTHDPKPGRNDAERNCVSNVRLEGLSYREAVSRVVQLIVEGLRLGLTGVGLKEGTSRLID